MLVTNWFHESGKVCFAVELQLDELFFFLPCRTRCHDENSVYANLLSNIGFNTGLEVCKAVRRHAN